jgi:hypothetical protein
MKNTIFTLILFCSLGANAQFSLGLNFNDIYIGRNMGIVSKYHFNHFSISATPTYFINRKDKTPYNTFFKKSGLASKFSERIGFRLGIEYPFYKNEYITLSAYYNAQFSNVHEFLLHHIAIEPLVDPPQSVLDYSVQIKHTIFGPVFSVDNVIGVSIDCKLSERISMNLKGGFGLLFWKNSDDSHLVFSGGKINQGIVFTSSSSLGLNYTF